MWKFGQLPDLEQCRWEEFATRKQRVQLATNWGITAMALIKENISLNDLKNAITPVIRTRAITGQVYCNGFFPEVESSVTAGRLTHKSTRSSTACMSMTLWYISATSWTPTTPTYTRKTSKTRGCGPRRSCGVSTARVPSSSHPWRNYFGATVCRTTTTWEVSWKPSSRFTPCNDCQIMTLLETGWTLNQLTTKFVLHVLSNVTLCYMYF